MTKRVGTSTKHLGIGGAERTAHRDVVLVLDQRTPVFHGSTVISCQKQLKSTWGASVLLCGRLRRTDGIHVFRDESDAQARGDH